MGSYMLHEELNLYITGTSRYTFVPANSGSQPLVIQRNTGEISLDSSTAPSPSSLDLARTKVFGIVGLISLALSEYIIIITSRELRGQILGHNVYRAADFQLLPLSPDPSIEEHPLESHLVSLVKLHLSSGLFWFSYGYDLTRRLQAQWATQENDVGKAMWEVAEDRFFWNKFLQSRLISIAQDASGHVNASPYILPMIYGTFDTRVESLKSQTVRFTLISRRSRYRAGTRYFRRGIDSQGNVANFNETEQLLFADNSAPVSDQPSIRMSFVQTRGSIPLYWAEVNTLRYKPDLQIMDKPDTIEAVRLHLQGMVNTYGQQRIVNLLNHKGHEGPLKEAFERAVKQADLQDVQYKYFDFHSECKHMRWDKVSDLITSIESDLNSQGYFHYDASSPKPIKLQTGTVRTNCMDNLDRTNVVQTSIAKWTLTRQLRELGILSPGDSIDNYDDFMKDFREMWTDHADLISKAYSGTGALKTDFTRTGKRTKAGLLDDGWNSVIRYLKNNLLDGTRQDAFDLVTGAWVPKDTHGSAAALLIDQRPLIIRAMPYMAFFSIFMILAAMTLPRSSDYSLSYYFLFWFTAFMLSTYFIFGHGIDYVCWPRLNPLTDAIHYDGPGYRSGHHGKGIAGYFPQLEGQKAGSRTAAWVPGKKGTIPVDVEAKKRVD